MDRSIPPGRVAGTLTPPCSKSYAQRALAASLLCDGVSTLHNLGFCDDTRSALRCIRALGARVRPTGDASLAVEGGLHPVGRRLPVGESGLATRLFTPIASLCTEPVRIEGEGTLLHRPMGMMVPPLRQLGVRVKEHGGHLPFEVCGPMHGGEVTVDGSVSSQFVTGLLLALPRAAGDTTLHVRDAVSTPYLDMTLDTAARFGVEIFQRDYEEFYIPGAQRYCATELHIEGDWSAAAMLLVAGATAGEVTVTNVPMLSKQADTAVCTALVRAGAAVINDARSVTAVRRPLRAFEFDATLSRPLPGAGRPGRRGRGGEHPARHLAPAPQGERPRRGDPRGVRPAGHRGRPARRGCHDDPRRRDPRRARPQPRRPPHGHVAGRGGAAVTIEDAECVAKSYPEFFEDLESIRIR